MILETTPLGRGSLIVPFVLLVWLGCSPTQPVVETGPTLSDVETFDPSPYADEEPHFEGDINHQIPEQVLDRSRQVSSVQLGPRNVAGFRIQLVSFQDRTEANVSYQKAISWWRSTVEEEEVDVTQPPVYLQWEQPYWKVRVGNYETRVAAETDVDEARKQFPSAFIVPTTITLQ